MCLTPAKHSRPPCGLNALRAGGAARQAQGVCSWVLAGWPAESHSRALFRLT